MNFPQTSITVPLERASGKEQVDIYKPSNQITRPPAEKLAQFRKLVCGSKVGKVQVGESASDVSSTYHLFRPLILIASILVPSLSAHPK